MKTLKSIRDLENTKQEIERMQKEYDEAKVGVLGNKYIVHQNIINWMMMINLEWSTFNEDSTILRYSGFTKYDIEFKFQVNFYENYTKWRLIWKTPVESRNEPMLEIPESESSAVDLIKQDFLKQLHSRIEHYENIVKYVMKYTV